MTWLDILWRVVGALGSLAGALALLGWTMVIWMVDEGDWLQRAANFIVWVLTVTTVIWLFNRQGVPA